MSEVLQPPEIHEHIGPIIFLAGPIQDAPDWQALAIEIIGNLDADIAIASPRKDYASGEFIYEEQVDWETHYLHRAASWGAVLFWLANQKTSTTEPGQKFPRPYAQTTRQELGEWRAKKLQDPRINLVVGIDDNFSNAKYIKRRLNQEGPDVPILSSLEETCKTAVQIIK
jgi:hypothetical protein